MRRYITTITAAILMAACFAGCSSDSDSDSDPVVLSNGQTQVSGVQTDATSGDPSGVEGVRGICDFVYNGVSVRPGTSPFDVVDRLGDYSLFESESCAFQGTDRVYTYASFIIRSSPDPQGNDVIVSIELRDDTIGTADGAYIGMNEEDVIDTYGEPDNDLPGGIEYTEGDCILSFVIADGKVSAINYSYVNE